MQWHALFEEPTLDRSETRACLRGAFAERFDGAAHRQPKFGDCWVLKDVSRSDLKPHASSTGNNLNAQDRITAKLEEVVPDANASDAKHALPDARKLNLGFGAGRLVVLRRFSTCEGDVEQ